MDNPIRLDDLSLEALNAMATMIVGLKEAGDVMREQGFEPRFDLRPGFRVRMALDYRMPLANPLGEQFHAPNPTPPPSFMDACDAGLASIEVDDDRQAWIVVPDPAREVKTGAEDLTLLGGKLSLAPTPVTAADIDAAVSGAFIAVTGRDPQPVPQYGDEDAADPAPAATAQLEKGAPWTRDEDERLVQMVARGMVQHGETKGTAIRAAASALRRPTEGAKFRLHTKLAEPLAAAIAALQAGQSEPAAPDPTKASPADSGGGADPSPAAPVAPAPSTLANTLTAATLSPIEQHLLNMSAKGGWTLELDRDVLQRAEDGWTTHDIALDMGFDGKAVQDRFDLLTGWDRDAKTRKYTRAALLAAAKDLCAKTHAAAE